VRAGNVKAAKDAFATGRYHYETIEPVAESFGDLDPQIDARENDVTQGQPWTGFHRIEKGLWVSESTKGLRTYAERLDADIAKLKAKVDVLDYQPTQIANGAQELLDEVSKSKITGEEDRYSHTDISDFAANVEGSAKAWSVVQPAIAELNPDLAKSIDERFSTLSTSLAKHKNSDGSYDYYTSVSADQRRLLAQQVGAVAEPLSQVGALIASCGGIKS